jgi:hypothetical protein
LRDTHARAVKALPVTSNTPMRIDLDDLLPFGSVEFLDSIFAESLQATHRITASEVPGNTQPGGFRPIPLRMKHGMEAHELQKVGPHNCNADERVFR